MTYKNGLGEVTDKRAAREAVHATLIFVIDQLNYSRERLAIKQAVCDSYLKKKYPLRHFFIRGWNKAYWRTHGILTYWHHIAALEQDIESLKSVMKILNNRLVTNFFMTERMCEILNFYESFLEANKNTK